MPAASEAITEPALAYVDLAHLMQIRGQARGFTLLPRHIPRSVLAGRHASRLRGRGLSFEELRRYQEGDDVRLIDWLATARTGSPHVRVYSEERDRAVLLLVDQRRTMFFGSRLRTKSAAAAELAALIAWRVNAAGDRVGAIVFNDADIVALRPGRGPQTVSRLLAAVARQNGALTASGGAGNAGMLNVALERAARMVQHDALVVLISDADGADEDSRKLMSGLAEHNDVVASFVYDPLEAALPALGRVVVAEGTERLAVDLDLQTVRAAHGAAFSAHRSRIEALARQRAIPVLALRTDVAVSEQVRAALAPRQRR